MPFSLAACTLSAWTAADAEVAAEVSCSALPLSVPLVPVASKQTKLSKLPQAEQVDMVLMASEGAPYWPRGFCMPCMEMKLDACRRMEKRWYTSLP